jgi:hypothetical protein
LLTKILKYSNYHSHENGNPKSIILTGFPLSPKGMPVAVGMTEGQDIIIQRSFVNGLGTFLKYKLY